MRHRLRVLLGWIVLAVVVNVIAGSAGRHYATNFSLPNTQSQHVYNLLKQEFPAQSGDTDEIVFHYANGPISSPQVKAAIEPLLAAVAKQPHVDAVISPYTPAGALQISKDGHTAFATVKYTKLANLLPNNTGKPLLAAIDRIDVPGLKLAAGGQVIEAAQGFSIGSATFVGVVAALVILLITFGSLVAAGLPLLTAGIGLIVGLALVGLSTHVFDVTNVAPDMALMIGLGVGVDYALFIVTRFKEAYERSGDVEAATLEAMDTSGRAVLLAGGTVVIALLGMFLTGISFMYGLSIASVLAVLMVLLASLTVVPAALSKYGRLVLGRRRRRTVEAHHASQVSSGPPPVRKSAWRSWSLLVQRRPWLFAIAALAVMIAVLSPFFGMRLLFSDAGNDPSNTSTYRAFNMLADGFGPGFNGPLTIAVELNSPSQQKDLLAVRGAVAKTADVGAVSAPYLAPSGKVALLTAYPVSAPQAVATTNLVHKLRNDVLKGVDQEFGVSSSVGGLTASSIDFSNVLSSRMPLFIGAVVLLSALLLMVIFRSIVIPIQAALMNLLSIGGALGATVAVFQFGWFSGLLGVQKAPIEPWIPVILFAVVFGLSMDYEVFLISRIREEWVHKGQATAAVTDGLAYTGRVITAAAAIMICVFMSFMLGDERAIKEMGFGLAAAVFLDAIVVRCVLVPSVLQILGASTWKLPGWLDRRLPNINIEGSSPAD